MEHLMASSDKTMDVSKPGKVAADASAKPIIVTHRPMVQDPMMKPETDVSDLESQKDNPKENKSTPTSGEKVIQPIDKDLKADPSEIDKAAAAAVAPKQKAKTESKDEETPDKETETSSEAVVEKPAEEVSPADDKTDKSETNIEETAPPKDEVKKPSSTSGAAEVDAIVDQATAGKHKEKQEAEQEAAKQDHLQKLIDDKKYFVKTGQVARRRNNRIALTFLVLIVLVIGLYIAVDVGAIKPGFDVPVHVINT